MGTHEELVRALERAGVVPGGWSGAVRAVDRGRFIPDRIGEADRSADPAGWAAAVYADQPVVTQVDDGKPGGPGLPTSSSSKPSVMLEMLALADIADDDRVFLIGTATGYQTAMLCERLGSGRVVTVEYDDGVYREGRERLRQAGYRPVTLHGDGLRGSPEHAPFDKVIATCGLDRIPGRLLAQVRDGGRIVAPFGTAFHSYSYVALDVRDGRGTGRFSGNPDFMWARQQRHRQALIADVYHGEEGTPAVTTIDPYDLWHQGDAEFWIGLHVPDAWAELHTGGADAPGEATYWLLSNDRRSWATVEFVAGEEEFATEQYGPRRLWSEVEHAHRHWQEAGRPGRDEFGLTAAPDSGWVWRGDPGRVTARLW